MTTTSKHFLFSKSTRLLSSCQFRQVMKYGRTVSGKYLLIQVWENKKSSLKVGLTVSRKFGPAVQRNRFKRLVREAFRLSQYELPPCIHLNIRPVPTYTSANLEELKQELVYLCADVARI